ncbi:sodium sulfate co-transporter, partial [Raphidocelis subcapitata]
FPIAANLAKKLALDMDMMSIAVMLGGSAGWVLPYSYQCNLMVMAAGGYRTKDFAIFGAPFHAWLLIGVILILGAGKNVYIPLIATGVFTALIVALPLIYEKLLSPGQRAALGRSLRSLLPCGAPAAVAAEAEYAPAPAALAAAGARAGGEDRGERDQLRATGGYGRQW